MELRDKRAAQLGKLLVLKNEMEGLVRRDGWDRAEALARLRRDVDRACSVPSQTPKVSAAAHQLMFETLPTCSESHRQVFATLRRPSKLTRLWPRLVLIPIVSLVGFRVIYSSRDTIVQNMLELHDTLKGFWFGYVVEPLKGILST